MISDEKDSDPHPSFGQHERTFAIVEGFAVGCKHQPMRGLDGHLSNRRRRPWPASRVSTFSLLSVAMSVTVGTMPGRADGTPNQAVARPLLPTTAGPLFPSPTGPTRTAPWTLAFGGDILLTRPIAATADPFAGIRPPLVDADLAIVNLETSISARGRAQTKEFTFRSAPSFADRIAAAGIDVVSLANNHTLDFGVDALRDTIANLDRVDVAHVGAGSDIDEALAPTEFEINTVAVAVLGASQIIPSATWPASQTRAGIASGGRRTADANTQRLLEAVAHARVTNDVVVVVLHWGVEGDPCPSPVQRNLAAQLVRAGATAVLGAHPHVLQPIVRIPTANGDAVVAYSMGNFIWDPRTGATADTGLLRLQFDGPRLTGATFSPHRLDSRGWARAVPTGGANAEAIAARVNRRCAGVIGAAIDAPASA